MKLFVFTTLLAVALAAPTTNILLQAPTSINTIATAPIVTQYHSQDELGQYSYGYSGGLSAKSETKSLDGVTRGAYSFLDSEGKMQTVEYTADALNGFRAVASNMPVAPVETRSAPLPVVETPEVAQARADHMVAFEEAKVRAAAEPESSDDDSQVIEAAAAAPQAKTVTPAVVASIAPIAAAPLPVLRTAEGFEHRPVAFSYTYSTPFFGYNPYTLGYPFNFVRSALPIAAPFVPQQYIPQPVAETPEVAQARAEHLAAHAQARARL